ncbi:hypothetical protein D3C84_1305420 [compost metagenome]
MGHLTGQQRAKAMTEQRIRCLERSFLFLRELQRQASHVGVQGFAKPGATPWEFHGLQLEPLR